MSSVYKGYRTIESSHQSSSSHRHAYTLAYTKHIWIMLVGRRNLSRLGADVCRRNFMFCHAIRTGSHCNCTHISNYHMTNVLLNVCALHTPLMRNILVDSSADNRIVIFVCGKYAKWCEKWWICVSACLSICCLLSYLNKILFSHSHGRARTPHKHTRTHESTRSHYPNLATCFYTIYQDVKHSIQFISLRCVQKRVNVSSEWNADEIEEQWWNHSTLDWFRSRNVHSCDAKLAELIQHT